MERTGWPGAPVRRLWELATRIDAGLTGGRFPLIPAAWYPHTFLGYGKPRKLHQMGAFTLVT